MRRLRAVLLLGVFGALLATSCYPLPDQWGEDPYGATVQVLSGEARVGSGEQPILGGTLFVFGTDLQVGEKSCRVVEQHLECPIPPMPPKKNYVLPLAGHNIVADALIERPGGARLWARKVGQ